MMSPTRLFVSVAEPVVYLKIAGRANFASSVDFKMLVSELRRRGCHRFVLDLTDCPIMDSTFLGVLAGLGLQLAQSAPATSGSGIELLNPHARIADLLDNLGIAHLFQIIQGVPPLNPCAETTPSAVSREAMTRTSLEAHQTLMAVQPANIPKFKDVVQFLAEDLNKLKPGPI